MVGLGAWLCVSVVGCVTSGTDGGDDRSIPKITVAAQSGDLLPAWSWLSSGGTGTFRYRLDAADLSTGATTTKDTSLTQALPQGLHRLYLQEQRSDGWSGLAQAQVVVTGRPPLVCVGVGFACAVTQGTVKCWGYGGGGSLGQGDPASRGGAPGQMGDALPAVALPGTPVAVTCGAAHVCAQLTAGDLRCWGQNPQGQLGLGDTTTRGDAPGQMGRALGAVAVGGVLVNASAGAAMTAALLIDGSVTVWGLLQGGGQNYPNPSTLTLPTAATGLGVGEAHTCVRLVDGSLRCWGNNQSGQLGLGDTADRASTAPGTPDLGAGRSAWLVQAGGRSTCVILDNGLLKCWGQTAFPAVETRTGDALPAIDVGTGHFAVGMALGSDHTCILREDGAVKCWGDNGHGQLGGPGDSRGADAGDAVPAVNLGTGRSAAALTAGGSNTCAVLDNGDLKCWGDGSWGQLGAGDTAVRGTAAAQMGDALPAVPL